MNRRLTTTTALFLALALLAAVGRADDPAAAELEPRVIVTDGGAHGKALVQSVDPERGVVLFAWLDADGEPVDSGHSVARFTPPEPVVDGETGAETFPDPGDAALASAIVASSD